MVIFDWLKVWVFHSVSWCHSLSVVILEHLGEQVDCILGDKLVVLRRDKFGPWLARVLP